MHQDAAQESNRFFLVSHLYADLLKNSIIVHFGEILTELDELRIVQILDLFEILKHLHHVDQALNLRRVNKIAKLQKYVADIFSLLFQCRGEYFNCFRNLCSQFKIVV